MKVKVVKGFADKFQLWKTHKVGDVIDVPDDRAKDLIGRGLATSIEPAKKTEEESKPVPKKRQKAAKNVNKGKTSVKNND